MPAQVITATIEVFAALTPAARRYLLHTALLTGGLAISALFFNLLLVALGYDQQTLRLPLLGDLSLLGLINSAPVLAAALGSLPLWWLVNRLGLRSALVMSALLSAASLLGIALWPAPLSMLAWAALGGPAAVLYQVSAAPFMMRHSGPAGRDMLFALSAGLTIAVAGLGSLVGGLLPGLLAGPLALAPQSAALYRATFGVAAALVALAALPLLRAARGHERDVAAVIEPQSAAARAEANDRASPPASSGPRPNAGLAAEARFVLGATRHALRFIVSPLLISCGAALLIPFLNLYLRQRFGAPDAALGLVFALIGIATGAATLAAPLLARRLGQMVSVVLTQALAIPCLLLLAVAPSLWLASVIALSRGALMNMAAPLYDAYAMEHTPPAARPIVIGLIGGAFSFGYIIGPTVSAQIQRDYGFGPIFIATAGFYACGALANYLIFLRPGRS